MSSWPRVVLLGDSITQYSLQPNGWGTYVAQQVQRKCDLINRGFSGYNTDNIVQFLSKLVDAKLVQNVAFVTIFLGANDSVLPGSYSNQHVPVDRFETNLFKIVEHFKSLGVSSDKIILIAPPPVEAELRAKHMMEKGNGSVCDRSNDTSIEYAKACVKVANSKKCRVIDLFTLMINKHLPTYLNDGLHFSDEGNSLLASELSTHVEELTKELEMNLPDWKDLCGVE
uniref:Isoamyl acetate-hydrolyzing esterase 1 homolog n=1 Tax=Phallusia mammillata TaxID=59560 RepID=A0A6F9DFG1_9ASCI|nr:isoamyl acetate-hydrolyzing esterase 1 homolog [Phallusia mammillata]